MTRILALCLGLAALLLPAAARAACPPIPFVFAQGSPFNANQVNTNFTSLRDCYNATPGVFGPSTTTINDVATWNNATGTLLKGSGTAKIRGTVANFNFFPDTAAQEQFTYTATTSANQTAGVSDSGYSPFWWLKQTTSGLGLGLNHGTVMFEADIADTGTVVNDDSWVGIAGNCNLLGTRTNAAPAGGRLGAACIGGSLAARGVAHQGGLPGFEQGEIHAANIIAGVSNIPPYPMPHDYADIIGAEVNITGCTGCTMLIRYGFNSIDFGNGGAGDSEQGSRSDAAYNIASVFGTKGWKTGINFSGLPTYGGNAISPTGTVLGSDAATPTVVAQGIDLSNFTISGNAFECPNGLCAIDGTGNLGAAIITAQTGFIANAVVGGGAFIEYSTSNTKIWRAGREATTQDYIIQDVVNGDVNFRLTAAGVFALGQTDPVTVSSTGVFAVPGGGQTIGAPAGGAKGAGTLNIEGAIWANNTVGVTCGPGATTAAFQAIGGIVVAC